MGKLNKFEVVLSNQNATYRYRDVISGAVLIDLNSPLKTKDIYITIEGISQVKLSRKGDYKGSEEDTHLKHVISLIAKDHQGESDESVELPVGSHTFPFQWRVFENLPPSFKGRYGHVRYTVKARIKQFMKFDDIASRDFAILPSHDLNYVPNAERGEEVCDSQTFFCLCQPKGYLDATFSVERTGFVPGETIRMWAIIKNFTGSNLRRLEVGLFNVSIFTVNMFSWDEDTRMDHVSKGSIASGREDVWDNIAITVPSVTASFKSKLIQLKYEVRLTIYGDRGRICLILPLKIAIGTIPLQSVVAQSSWPIQQSQPQSVSHTGWQASMVQHNEYRNTNQQYVHQPLYQSQQPQFVQQETQFIDHTLPQQPIYK